MSILVQFVNLPNCSFFRSQFTFVDLYSEFPSRSSLQSIPRPRPFVPSLTLNLERQSKRPTFLLRAMCEELLERYAWIREKKALVPQNFSALPSWISREETT